MTLDLKFLNKKWIHAHEEDTSECLVFRPESYPLGLSRSRDAIEFYENGKVARIGIAPNDAMSFSEGNWRLLDDGKTLSITENPDKTTRLKVIGLLSDKLTISR
jgi:hypothetical protein